ncbi:hypothetical protein G9A89_016809 [Geosiphon pyriformis]|nr:hypothetical protein G9A89_016809 [Geosiphon pyriformis]
MRGIPCWVLIILAVTYLSQIAISGPIPRGLNLDRRIKKYSEHRSINETIPEQQSPPIGTETDQVTLNPSKLSPTYSTCMEPGTLALTFDDGPAPITNALLDTLKEKNVKATFFLNGSNRFCVYYYKDVLLRIIDEGHQLGHHTWSHPNLVSLSDNEIIDQMFRLETALRRIIGMVPSYMRPPFEAGIDDDRVRSIVGGLGYKMVGWNIDPADAFENEDNLDKQKEAITEQMNLYPSLAPHIILNHDPLPMTTNDLVPWEIDNLLNAGYKFKTVGECLGDSDPDSWYKEISPPEEVDPNTWNCDN